MAGPPGCSYPRILGDEAVLLVPNFLGLMVIAAAKSLIEAGADVICVRTHRRPQRLPSPTAYAKTFYFRAVPIPLTVRSATSFTNYFKQDAARKKATKKESAFSFLKNFTRACESMPSSMP